MRKLLLAAVIAAVFAGAVSASALANSWWQCSSSGCTNTHWYCPTPGQVVYFPGGNYTCVGWST